MILRSHSPITAADFEGASFNRLGTTLFAPYHVMTLDLYTSGEKGPFNWMEVFKTHVPLGPPYYIDWTTTHYTNVPRPKWLRRKLARGTANWKDINKYVEQIRRSVNLKLLKHSQNGIKDTQPIV